MTQHHARRTQPDILATEALNSHLKSIITWIITNNAAWRRGKPICRSGAQATSNMLELLPSVATARVRIKWTIQDINRPSTQKSVDNRFSLISLSLCPFDTNIVEVSLPSPYREAMISQTRQQLTRVQCLQRRHTEKMMRGGIIRNGQDMAASL